MPQGSELKVRVTPRASQNRATFAAGVLKVHTTAAPVDGQANKSVIGAVAKALKVPKSTITIIRGESSRDKVLYLETLTGEALVKRLQAIEGRKDRP